MSNKKIFHGAAGDQTLFIGFRLNNCKKCGCSAGVQSQKNALGFVVAYCENTDCGQAVCRGSVVVAVRAWNRVN